MDKPKRKFNPEWGSAKRDIASGAAAARTAGQRKAFAEATGHTSVALVKALQAGQCAIVRNGETIGGFVVWIDNGEVKLIEQQQ